MTYTGNCRNQWGILPSSLWVDHTESPWELAGVAADTAPPVFLSIDMGRGASLVHLHTGLLILVLGGKNVDPNFGPL